MGTLVLVLKILRKFVCMRTISVKFAYQVRLRFSLEGQFESVVHVFQVFAVQLYLLGSGISVLFL